MLDRIKYYRRFEAGQTVIFSGDRMDFVGSVVTGIATLTQTMEDGRRQMVGLLLPSDFVGRPGRDSAAYDVVATSDIVMCCFRKKPFEEMMARTPHSQVSALKRDGVISLEGKRRVMTPDFNRLLDEAGDDSDGGLPA